MGLQERLDALQPRERRLLTVFVALFVVISVLLIPIAVSAMLAERQTQNEQLHAAIERLLEERSSILERKERTQRLLDRYRRAAPALAAFLDKQAKALDIEIPEFKDRPPLPHGKDYEERSTDISLKKVGMRKLILFMEGIAQAEFSVSITRFNLRKRGVEPDSWDVTMTVSAYHRPGVEEESEKSAGAPVAEDDDKAEPEAEPEDDGEPEE